MTSIDVGELKMARESLCRMQHALTKVPYREAERDMARLQGMIDQIDVLRPLGPDGKHGDRHTPWCGCEGVTQYIDMREQDFREKFLPAQKSLRERLSDLGAKLGEGPKGRISPGDRAVKNLLLDAAEGKVTRYVQPLPRATKAPEAMRAPLLDSMRSRSFPSYDGILTKEQRQGILDEFRTNYPEETEISEAYKERFGLR